ncbi:MAG TPA: hypothetical protein VNA89_07680, partial [Gemmatimonadaceae bacterium]|nr:hypothetical protein [Gemmatimonadaceae bacterium]
YRDLEFRHALTLYGGQFNAAKDPAGVAPQAGPLLGVRYDWRLGGPATFTARVAHVWSEREIVDPEAVAAARRLGVQDWSLYLADLGFTIALTGRKSFYRMVPVLYAGLGVASDFKGRDIGDYKFGTAFALAFGAGVRWVPTGRLELRADVGDHLYQIKYPSSYYQAASDGTQVLPGTRPQSLWKHNAALTLGAAYQLFR